MTEGEEVREEPVRKDPAPKDAVQVSIRMSHNLIRPDCAGTVWAVLELRSGTVEREGQAKRLPLNVGLVLDRSGSMSGQPLEYVKDAATFVVGQVGAADRFSLVTFDDEVSTVCPSQQVTDKDRLKSAIGGIQAGGLTNLSGGFLRGFQEVLRGVQPGQVNRIILLTDGQANVGIQDPAILAGKSRTMAEKGVSVSSIGVGDGFNEDLLMAMSDAGRGNFYYIKNPDEIPRVFAEELEGLLTVVAQGMRVTVAGGDGFGVGSVLGYEPGVVPEGAFVDLPDMYENETKVLILGLTHPALPVGNYEVLKAGVEYADAVGNLDAVSLNASVRLSVGDGPAESYEPNIEIIKIVELTRTALAKDQAVDLLDKGDVEQGKKVLEERLNSLNELQRSCGKPDEEIVTEARNLESLLSACASEMDSGDPSKGQSMLRESSFRKDLRYQSYMRRRSRKPGSGDGSAD